MVSIPQIILLGVGAIATFFFFRRAAETSIQQATAEVGASFGSIGTGIGTLGTGFSTLGTGIGSGITGLFQPLLFFKELLFGNEPIVNAPSADTVQSIASRERESQHFDVVLGA